MTHRTCKHGAHEAEECHCQANSDQVFYDCNECPTYELGDFEDFSELVEDHGGRIE